MSFEIKTNAPEIAATIRALAGDQIPFAIAYGVTRTAWNAVDAQREGMEDRFTIRRKWVLRGVRVTKRAEKSDGEAHVAILPDRGFLVRFEDGGTVQPEKASRFAVPQEAKRTGTGVLRKNQRPRSFNFKKWGSGPVADVYRGDRRAFLIRKKDGTGGIYQRYGRSGRTRVRQLFSFTPDAQLEALLQFEPTAREVVAERLAPNIDEGLDRALGVGR